MQGYNELKHSVARIDCNGLEGFLIQGSDAEAWLQGQVTNDLSVLGEQDWIDACLVKSTGQIEADLRLFRHREAIVILTPASPVLIQRVEDFVILEDVSIVKLGPVMASLQGPEASVFKPQGGVLAWRSPRTGSDGWEFVDAPSSYESVVHADWDATSLVTLEAGIAVVGVDSDEKTLPPELGRLFDSTHVAYDKGCYVGQEVLQRIHSRGHTNKEWGVYCSAAPVTQGDLVTSEAEPVGRVTRSVVRAGGTWIFGAVVKNQAREPGVELAIHGKPVLAFTAQNEAP